MPKIGYAFKFALSLLLAVGAFLQQPSTHGPFQPAGVQIKPLLVAQSSQAVTSFTGETDAHDDDDDHGDHDDHQTGNHHLH